VALASLVPHFIHTGEAYPHLCYLYLFVDIYRVNQVKIREEVRMDTITHRIGNTCAFCGVAIVAAVAIITLVTLVWVAII